MLWLVEASVHRALERAQHAGLAPTVEQHAQFTARYTTANDARSSIVSVESGTATIRIEGILTQAPDFLAALVGGGNTTYGEIRAALAEAESDQQITQIVLAMDSGGGQFDGLFDTLATLQATTKPIEAVVSNLCASAAYAIASQANRIVAAHRATRVGSIGVAASFRVFDDEVAIASTHAPKKRPDVKTPEGIAVVREELDALHALFVETIAAGRHTSMANVNTTFGQGATLLADEALHGGMIDSIAGVSLPAVNPVKHSTSATATGRSVDEESHTMDLPTLQAQHPDVYAAAVQCGIHQERDRVTAHLIMGEQSGAMDTAAQAIKEGLAMSATLQATYMTAGMNRADIQRRDEDNASASAGDQAADLSGDNDEQVVALLEAKLGLATE